MSITEQVQNDMILAMKAHDKERAGALRMILSELKMGKKEAGGSYGKQEEIAVLRKEKKRRLQAAEAFRKGGRDDRAQKEEAEAAIIDSYLPRQLDEEELAKIIDEVIAETNAAGLNDMGKVMSLVMPRTAGRADRKVVSGMVKSRLGGR
jgi:uncharacterized protein YqeY